MIKIKCFLCKETDARDDKRIHPICQGCADFWELG